jgi:hypothetical protein
VILQGVHAVIERMEPGRDVAKQRGLAAVNPGAQPAPRPARRTCRRVSRAARCEGQAPRLRSAEYGTQATDYFLLAINSKKFRSRNFGKLLQKKSWERLCEPQIERPTFEAGPP